MAQTHCICPIWIWEALWGGSQPQPWCYDIIHNPQANLNSQIWGKPGRWHGIKVHAYGLETAYQWLKHFVHVYYWCLKWSDVDLSLKTWPNDIIFTPQVTWILKNWGQLGRWCNSIRVHPNAIETAYQWLKHVVYVACGCGKWYEVDLSLNHDVMTSFLLHKWPTIHKSGANLAGGTV